MQGAEAAEPGLEWADALIVSGLERLTSTTLDVPDLRQLIFSLGCLLQPWAPSACVDMEGACLRVAGQGPGMLEPTVMTACIVIFVTSDHTPGQPWLEAVVQAMSQG